MSSTFIFGFLLDPKKCRCTTVFFLWSEERRLHVSMDFSVALSSSSLVQTGRYLQNHDTRRYSRGANEEQP